MPPNRCRRVQAQRKFAAGAYIPPSASSNGVPERRNDVNPPREENRNIIYNNMSPDNFLNVVAFQRTYKYLQNDEEISGKQPVVVLERINPRIRKIPVVARKRRVVSPPPSEQTDEDDRPLRYIAQALRRKSSRKARQRQGASPAGAIKRGRGGGRRVMSPSTRLAPLPRLTPMPRLTPLPRFTTVPRVSLRRSSRQQAAPVVWVTRAGCSGARGAEKRSDSAALAVPGPKKTKRIPKPRTRQDPSPPATRKRVFRNKRESPKQSPTKRSRAKQPAKEAAVAPNTRQTATSTVESDVSPPKRAKPSSPVKAANARKIRFTNQELLAVTSDSLVQSKTRKRSMVEVWLKKVTDRPPDDVEQDRINFKVPRIPLRRADEKKKKPSPRKLVAPDDAIVEIPLDAPMEAEAPPSAPENTTAQNESAKMFPLAIDETASTVNLKENVIEIDDDVVEVPLEPAATCPATRSCARSARPPQHSGECGHAACVSRHYNTVRSIVHADERELSSRCSNCAPCARVDKIRRISRLVEHQRARGSDDVYEFREETPRVPHLRPARAPRSPPAPSHPPRPLSVSAPAGAQPAATDTPSGEYPKYLDLFPLDQRLMVEINPIQTKGKAMMTARLIPRTAANIVNEFSLIDHDNLLDQLFSRWMNDMIARGDFPPTQTNRGGAEVPVAETVVISPKPDPVETTIEDSIEILDLEEEEEEGSLKLFYESEEDETQPQPSMPVIEYLWSAGQLIPQNDAEEPKPSTSGISTRSSVDTQASQITPSTVPPATFQKPSRADSKKSCDSPQLRRTEKDRGTPPPKKGEAPAPHKKPKKAGDSTAPPPEVPRNYLNASSRSFRDAPIFYPTEEEFTDPLVYFGKISKLASEFGLCKVVAPSSFRPACVLGEDVRFSVANQYLSRLFCRWGAASREMCAIKAYLAEQKVFFTRPPLIDGIELNLPKLYRTVQQHGGLKKVIEKKRWGRVAEDMRFPRGPRSAQRIDQLYVKHLLPYDTLSSAERRALLEKVERSWSRNYARMVRRAANPLWRQRRLLDDTSSSDDEADSDEDDDGDSDEDANLAVALAEAEDCVVAGRNMKLSVFQKVAENVMCNLFGQAEPSPERVEELYWELVGSAAEHVCVNSASIDTGEEGYGFTRNRTDPYHCHPWNLKMLSQNSGNVLRSLGPVLGVTVPTLHLGMVLATSCWHRDPHGLPWVEYLHQGPAKIWYGIPDMLSGEFRAAVEELCPTACQNKSIWLPSDITMIPPELLAARGVPLSRVVQRPGEFIMVLPKAYSSSISTGYTQSESVYFATRAWLEGVANVFQELRDSCEPTMFSLEQLVIAVAQDPRSSDDVLEAVHPILANIIKQEMNARRSLWDLGVVYDHPEQDGATDSQPKKPAGAWNVREQDECEVCRATLYLSKVTGISKKRSSFCLQHAQRVLMQRASARAEEDAGAGLPGAEAHAAVFVTREMMEAAINCVEERLGK